MRTVLGVPEAMAESVAAFVRGESIPLDVATDDRYTAQVVQSGEPVQCDPFTLYAGGWIACSTARAMAGKLKISTMEMGKLLNFLNIKVRRCELGLFK